MTWKNSSKGSTTGAKDWSRNLTAWWKKESEKGTLKPGAVNGSGRKHPLKEAFLQELEKTKRG
jgi:hypothetical protein